MKRQRMRKLILITSLLLFPITLYYFSPALIINAGLNGIINGSFIVFVFLFLLSIPFGRLFCSYLCPAGGLQECVFAVNEKIPKQGWRNNIKFAVWGICNSPFVIEEVALDENFRFSFVRGALRINSCPLIINMLLNVNPLLRALGGFDVQE